MKDLVSGLVKKLREKGLRVTEQRKAILEALAKSEAPKSAEETFSALPADTCDLVTAYRCLEQFEKAGVVELGVRENGTRVYCLGHGHNGHHHQLEEVAHGYGFTKVTHVMEVFGVCPSCS